MKVPGWIRFRCAPSDAEQERCHLAGWGRLRAGRWLERLLPGSRQVPPLESVALRRERADAKECWSARSWFSPGELLVPTTRIFHVCENLRFLPHILPFFHEADEGKRELVTSPAGQISQNSLVMTFAQSEASPYMIPIAIITAAPK